MGPNTDDGIKVCSGQIENSEVHIIYVCCLICMVENENFVLLIIILCYCDNILNTSTTLIKTQLKVMVLF